VPCAWQPDSADTLRSGQPDRRDPSNRLSSDKLPRYRLRSKRTETAQTPRAFRTGQFGRLPGMTPFSPLDGDILWSVSQGVEATRGVVGVFGTDSPYEAYLCVLAVKESGGSHLTL
jgi:hypothetical protein